MRKGNNGGFSLVEMLIALVISGIILTALALLVTQASASYTRQTVLAQLQNEADITLNQIETNILEASLINVVQDTSTSYALYTQAEGDIMDGYKLVGNTLYYAEGDELSLVCENVSSFVVKVNANSITFDNRTIKDIDENVRVDVSITLEKQGRERTVTRSFATRNDVSESIMLGVVNTLTGTGDDDISNYLTVGTTISTAQFMAYINED